MQLLKISCALILLGCFSCSRGGIIKHELDFDGKDDFILIELKDQKGLIFSYKLDLETMECTIKQSKKVPIGVSTNLEESRNISYVNLNLKELTEPSPGTYLDTLKNGVEISPSISKILKNGTSIGIGVKIMEVKSDRDIMDYPSSEEILTFLINNDSFEPYLEGPTSYSVLYRDKNGVHSEHQVLE